MSKRMRVNLDGFLLRSIFHKQGLLWGNTKGRVEKFGGIKANIAVIHLQHHLLFIGSLRISGIRFLGIKAI
ncbi:protein of unknown function [Xenorhabdus doucetiae]|uniref:Uncharacterized protein n=1 Tax=Xenorhabdus doucetiae TaxID=351671 RepID=A0A068QRS7_9GAMM|nr:protein of unknown function [Xenorhabdus doucetiae]